MNVIDLATRLQSLHPRTEEEASIRAIAFGALYAATLAGEYGYTIRRSHGGNENVREVDSFLSAITKHSITLHVYKPATPEERSWLAGFYFDDALFRTDIAFEWVARYVCRFDSSVHGCSRKIKGTLQRKRFPKKFQKSWDVVGDEVNLVKHRNQFKNDRMDYDSLAIQIKYLIDAVEWCFKRPLSRSPNIL